MQALILAAGLGRRLGKLTERSTKCMVELNGRRLIEYAFDALRLAGVERVVMVVGHGADEVRALLGDCYAGIPVSYVHNPLYAETNNIYSLYLAREHLAADDTLLLESDVVFDPTILLDCARSALPNVAVVARYTPWMDGTVAVLDGDGRVARFVPRAEQVAAEAGTYYKTVNLYRFSRQFARERLVPFLGVYMDMAGRSHFYEEVLRLLVYLGSNEIAALDIGDRRWFEIDDSQDLDIASALFAAESRRLAAFAGRFGGYWRFEQLRDFCYPANPYFPPPRMLDELARAAPRLLTSYPSGAAVQSLLAARLFGCDPASILVGNGAAELISALLPELNGRVGVPLPTFDEYLRLARPEGLVRLPASRPDLCHAPADLLASCTAAGLATLVIVNPAIPSGQHLPKAALLDLFGALRRIGTRVVLDESFVDFVDGSPDHSLLQPDDLAAHPNLVVIRSLGKSFGVPGLRLGVLGSGDRGLVEQLARRLPVWNVNSLAEGFLQSVGKYSSEYRLACSRLVEARAEFTARLERISFLRPVPSAANFVLCEVGDGWTSTELASWLLNEKWVLIRDCAAKLGSEGRSFVRIAVRGQEDSDYLVGCLEELERVGAPATAAT